ncbi:hypothetical protein [Streptosporangium sandarakinum]|uniref:hypothetical protein n=1 Tax=Streptosporangium sandarakinum TaxID=1260955 RepID=UPI003792E4DA
MENGRSTTSEFAIPGWRVIRSDAGRLWASRVKPFPSHAMQGPLDVPPFRTVDADTFEQLQAETATQEEAARQKETARQEAS